MYLIMNKILIYLFQQLAAMVRQRCVNPFFHEINISKSSYFQIILGTIILVPIRVILSLLIFLFASTLSRFYIFLLSYIDRSANPDKYHHWREICKTQICFVFRSILFLCGFYKVTIVQKGDIKNEKDAPIYVFAPHTSMFDILAGVTFNAPSSVAKADIVDIPLFGNIFKLSDPVLVERDSKDSRQDVFSKVSNTMKYSKIVFFPEGTCSNHRVLLQFKNGAFKFGYPIIPVALRFNQFGPYDTLSWTWDGPNTLVSVWLTLARWRTDLEITKLPVYYPTDEEKADPDLYTANVAKVLVKELRIPCLYYSFDDVRYFKYKFFRSSTCVKFMKLSDKLRQMKIIDDNNSSSTTTKPLLNPSTSTDIKSSETSTDCSSQLNGTSSNNARSETIFTTFLYSFIDEVNKNFANYDLNAPLDRDLVIKVLCAESVPGIQTSYSVKEFMYCIEKSSTPLRLLHLKAILCLIDLRVDDLWDRLHNFYDIISQSEPDGQLSFNSLKTILWLTLSLEDVDSDEEIDQIKIISFGDLKNLIKNYYDFALRENAKSICAEATNVAP